jgi:hypothetical protein
MITSSSTKETCYEILTGEQLFFSSHHNHKKKKKKRKEGRKEGRKEEKGVFLCSSNFLALITGLKQFVFSSPQKTNCFKVLKTKQKVSRKHTHPKQVFHDKKWQLPENYVDAR